MKKKILIYAKKGELIREIDPKKPESMKGLPPMIEAEVGETYDFSDTLITFEFFHVIYDSLKKYYQAWGKFGPYGELIQLSVEKNSDGNDIITIDSIGHLGFPKPSMAADILPFIITPDKIYFIGIIRKDNGLPAFAGGFREVRGPHFQNGIEAAIEEAKQETGLIIKPEESFCDSYSHKKSIRASVSLGEEGPRFIPCDLHLLGDYDTADTEKRENTKFGFKRVNETKAYILPINLEADVTRNILKGWLKPDPKEDAAEIFIFEIIVSRNMNIPRFGFDHHEQIFRDAVNKFFTKPHIRSPRNRVS